MDFNEEDFDEEEDFLIEAQPYALLEDPNIPLTVDLLSTLLAILIQEDPRSPLRLPSFRLIELMNIIRQQRLTPARSGMHHSENYPNSSRKDSSRNDSSRKDSRWKDTASVLQLPLNNNISSGLASSRITTRSTSRIDSTRGLMKPIPSTTRSTSLSSIRSGQDSEMLPVNLASSTPTMFPSYLPNEFRLVETYLAYTTFCFYMSLTTHYDFDIFPQIISLLQHLHTESLITEQQVEGEQLHMLHPKEAFRRRDEINIEHRLEIFTEGLNISRQIVRTTLRLVRYMEKIYVKHRGEERQAAIPHGIEPIKAYSLHFLANFALSHVILQLHSVGNLLMCPGLVDCLLLSLYHVPSEKSASQRMKSSTVLDSTKKVVNNASNDNRSKDDSSSTKKDKDIATEQPISFYRIMNYSHSLSEFVAHSVLDGRLLELLLLTRVRMSKNFNHPAVNLAQYRVSQGRDLLGLRPLRVSNESQEVQRSSVVTKGQIKFIIPSGFLGVLTMHFPLSRRTLADRLNDKELVEELRSLSIPPTRTTVPPLPSSTTSSLRENSISSSRQGENPPGSRPSGPSHANALPPDGGIIQQALRGNPLEQHFWQLKRNYRGLFVIFSSLGRRNDFSECFALDFVPDCTNLPNIRDYQERSSLLQQPITVAVRLLENYMYQWCTTHELPRILSPMEESYWFLQDTLELLSSQAQSGEGYLPNLKQEQTALVKKLRALHAETKDINVSKVQRKTPPPIPLPSKKQNPRGYLANTSEIGATKKATPKKTKDLSVLLNRAKQEAALENRLFKVESELKGQISQASNVDVSSLSPFPSTLLPTTPLNWSRPSSRLGTPLITPGFVRRVDHFSSVWCCPPKEVPVEEVPMFTSVQEETLDNPLADLPSHAAAIQYAEEIAQQKLQEEIARLQAKQELDDQQELLVSRNRTIKDAMLRKLRDHKKGELLRKATIHAQWEEQRRRLENEERARIHQENLQKAEATQRELERITRLKEIHHYKTKQKEEQYEEELLHQHLHIQHLHSQEDANEIIRQRQEEARMKFLEERQRKIEERLEMEKRAKLDLQRAKQDKLRQITLRFQARVRQGNFVWTQGSLGFYDNVRRGPLPNYIQYEDASGTPYYFDPIYNVSTYKEPQDSDIVHHTVEERAAYDAEHGEGAYDAYKADIAFRDAVNQYGGYYDENGEWQWVNGYYDENYEWVENEGYVDEYGRFVRYAKVTGDLSFMV